MSENEWYREFEIGRTDIRDDDDDDCSGQRSRRRTLVKAARVGELI